MIEMHFQVTLGQRHDFKSRARVTAVKMHFIPHIVIVEPNFNSQVHFSRHRCGREG